MSTQLRKKIISKVLYILSFSVIFLTSCVPLERLAYVQSERGTDPADMQYRNVLIIREEDGRRRIKHYIDLTSDELLESEWYHVKSDDIIYVEPLGRKKWGMEAVPYNLILSVITTTLVVITYIGRI
jgi:hypothetical protein